jgi:hypothetical protein
MLTVDIRGSTDHELQRIIGDNCAPHGSVVKVVLHISRTNALFRSCAIVDMASREQADQVAEVFAGTRIGRSVVVLVGAKAAHAVCATAEPAVPETRPKTMFQLLAQYEGELRFKCGPGV